MISRWDLAEEIRTSAKNKHISVEKIERESGVSRCRLRNFLTMQTNIKLEALDKILSFLGLTIIIGAGSNDKSLLKEVREYVKDKRSG